MPLFPQIVTLVADPKRPILSDALLAQAAQAVPASGLCLEWLARGIAADIAFAWPEPAAPKSLAEEIRSGIGSEPIDVIAQPRAGRRKKLLIADMDSTMIGQECIDELADFLGVKEKVAAITEQAMRGEIAFEPALRARVALLHGLEAAVVAEVIENRITLTPGARTLVRTMRAFGAHTALVSGGFTLFARPIAEVLGFHESRANVLIVEDGRLVGEVAEPILGREAKLAALLELRERHRLAKEDTLAVGDGANDLAMLQEAGLGVAYRAKPAVAAAAHARLDHADLTALLYAQGYRREEFAT